MPLYEYKCDQCAELLEVIQSFSSPPETICPKCGGSLRKMISAPAIQFKGSGFYKTDYPTASSSGPSTGSKSGGESSGSDSKSEAKSETKSESKSESTNQSKGESKSTSKAASE